MSRSLDTATLDQAAQDYAGQFLLPSVFNPANQKSARAGRAWVLQSMENFHYEDEFKYIHERIGDYLGPKALKDYQDAAAKFFTPYDDGELEHNLKTRLGVDASGKKIPGAIGCVKQGEIVIGWRMKDKEYKWIGGVKVAVPVRSVPRIVKAEVFAGETEDEARARAEARFAAQGIPIFPMSQYPLSMALATRISNEAALGACDYVVGRLDEGSGAAIIRILDGTQAADPDTAIGAQVTLATLVCSDPAFGSASDANPGGRATASAITSDSSADNTGTASWFRASATNDGAISLDDHIDGSVGTGTNDMVLNTVSIVSGATVSISSWTVTMPES